MRYMILIYGDESKWAALSPEKMSEEMNAYFAYSKALRESGKFVDGSELQPAATAKCVSLESGSQRVHDGPFADTKEALGGYYLVDTDTIDEAIKWAAKCPGARYGTLEVRPLVMR
jgi:hypothetical protein